MGYFTVLMNNNTKGLTVTKSINLYQFENLVDSLCFLVPYQYTEDIDLSEFNIVLEWLDPTNVAHTDVLTNEGADVYKEGYIRLFLPATSPLNRYAGKIEAKLVFTKTDLEEGKVYKLTTSTVIIPILTIKEYFTVIPDESFDAIDKKINQLQVLADQITAAAELYDNQKADNHTIDDEGVLYLTSHGTKIGDGINVAIPEREDDQDDDADGVIDLSYLDEVTI